MLTLMELIEKTESAGDLETLRFEEATYLRVKARDMPGIPAVADLISKIARFNRCNRATAQMIYSTSWGDFQLMGFNLYGACQIEAHVADFLASRPMQEAGLHNFLVSIHCDDITTADLVNDPVKRQFFISHYNGPGAVDAYWQRMLAILRANP